MTVAHHDVTHGIHEKLPLFGNLSYSLQMYVPSAYPAHSAISAPSALCVTTTTTPSAANMNTPPARYSPMNTMIHPHLHRYFPFNHTQHKLTTTLHEQPTGRASLKVTWIPVNTSRMNALPPQRCGEKGGTAICTAIPPLMFSPTRPPSPPRRFNGYNITTKTKHNRYSLRHFDDLCMCASCTFDYRDQIIFCHITCITCLCQSTVNIDGRGIIESNDLEAES